MSTKRSKRYQEAAKLVIPNKNYSITEAVETMKSFPAPKFDPTVTVSFHPVSYTHLTLPTKA